MNPVVHFEVPFEDKARAMKFYSDVFGWKNQDMPEMNYVVSYTTEVDEAFMSKEPNRINGGMREKMNEKDYPTIVIDVPDVEEHIKKIEEHGGSKVFGPQNVGNMGIYAMVKDTEGNVIGIWQTLKKE